jgi:uncharacterized protein YeeX (DUF496 family)
LKENEMSQDHSLWADSVTIAEIAQLRKDLAEREAQLHTAQRLLEIEQSIRGYADAAVKIEVLEQQLAECKKDYRDLVDDLAFLAGMEPSHSMVRAANRVLGKARLAQKEEA